MGFICISVEQISYIFREQPCLKAIAFKSSNSGFHGLHDNRNFLCGFFRKEFLCLKRGDKFRTFVNSITDAAGGCVLKEKVCEIFFSDSGQRQVRIIPGLPFSSGSGSYIHRVRRRLKGFPQQSLYLRLSYHPDCRRYLKFYHHNRSPEHHREMSGHSWRFQSLLSHAVADMF